MRKLTREELEFEICTLTKNIKVLKALGGDPTMAESKLALYHSKLLLLQLSDGATKE